MKEVTNVSEQELQRACYQYMADFSKMIYENEERREDSLIQQASHMQTAFSFVIAALFVVAPVVISYRGVLSLTFLLLVFSSITFVLLFCLFSATMAQNRSKREDFPKVSVIRKKIVDEYEMFQDEAQRSKYLVDTYEIMHESYARTNDLRVKWVRASMLAFYVAITLCAFWFVVAICKIA